MQDEIDAVAERLGALAESRPAPPPPRPAQLPDTDDDAALAMDDAERVPDPDGIAEGQTFMIEYMDTKGDVSTRRITVLEVITNKRGDPSLKARCHERKAQRRFRVDSILSCIDLDGEVHDHPVTFLNAALGLDLDPAIQPPDRDDAEDDYTPPKPPQDWHKINRMIVPHFSVLAALSRSDGTMRDSEVRAARDHCARLAAEEGFPVSDLTLEWIEKSIRRRHPTRGYIKRTMNDMRLWPPHHVTDLLIAALELIDVDGQRDPAEVALVNEISVAVTGMKMA